MIVGSSANPDADLAQLWRRVAFSVAISNVDDHLRNHGFLLDRQGWRLAPAYDVNPVAPGEGLSLAISEDDTGPDGSGVPCGGRLIVSAA